MSKRADLRVVLISNFYSWRYPSERERGTFPDDDHEPITEMANDKPANR